MAMTDPQAFWQGRRVLVTGHTGFKGSWLSLWLTRLGAEVVGFSLEIPTQPSLFEMARLDSLLDSHFGDVADLGVVERVIESSAPDVVVHLAAQSLVAPSHNDPLGTYLTNVMGTVNLLEAIRRHPSPAVALVVTSDKCYENSPTPHRESDRLGGSNPYSSSKACAEHVTQSYRISFFSERGSPVVASARAGNVIGGGDWATGRLAPDVVRAIQADEVLVLRNPGATRPWQHVLDCLSGYILLIERLSDDPSMAGPWNFGPADEEVRTVSWLVEHLFKSYGRSVDWTAPGEIDHPSEDVFLALDSSKARSVLGWSSRLDTENAVEMTADWYRRAFEGADPRMLSISQIEEYEAKPLR